MTLAIVVYVPDGIIMASDSRQSLMMNVPQPNGTALPLETVNSDNNYKTFLLSYPPQETAQKKWQVGISTFGQDMLGGVSMASHMLKFYQERLQETETVETIANKLREYFVSKFPGVVTGFHIAGYDVENRISLPRVYSCSVDQNLVAVRNKTPDGNVFFGASWSGQIDVLASILNPSLMRQPNGQIQETPKPPIVWDTMQLQDAIDFAIFAIKTTSDTIRFQARPKNVGGPIDILAITPEKGAFWIYRKELHA
jgi:hypothetical protein